MKYQTKQQRLCAIADAYRTKLNKSAFTTEEVAEWAIARGLWPVPKRGDPEDECIAWEARLLEAAA